MAEHPILKWWHVGAAALVVAVGYGSMLADVSNLKERVKSLEDRALGSTQSRTGKGDLCMKILDELGKSSDEGSKAMLWERWRDAECEGGVPARQELPDNQALGHPL